VTVVDRLNRVKCLSGEASSQVYVMSLCGKFNPKLFLRKSLIKKNILYFGSKYSPPVQKTSSKFENIFSIFQRKIGVKNLPIKNSKILPFLNKNFRGYILGSEGESTEEVL
jgi:hypothetical protein